MGADFTSLGFAMRSRYVGVLNIVRIKCCCIFPDIGGSVKVVQLTGWMSREESQLNQYEGRKFSREHNACASAAVGLSRKNTELYPSLLTSEGSNRKTQFFFLCPQKLASPITRSARANAPAPSEGKVVSFPKNQTSLKTRDPLPHSSCPFIRIRITPKLK